MRRTRGCFRVAASVTLFVMVYRPLGRTGLRLSVLGFGASPLGDVFGKTTALERERAVAEAIDLGVNFFDVAPFYGAGLAEKRLGETLAGKRDRVVVSTKCGRYGMDEFDFSAGRIGRSVDESLEALRTDYVDLLLAHDVEFGDVRQIVEETIPAMREAQRAGKARFIGVSGLQLGVLRRVAERAPVDVILSYCRLNLLNRDLERTAASWAEEQGIGLINASPLHMGVLTDSGPPSWHPAPAEVKEAGARVAALCREHGARVTDVALGWCAERVSVATTLTGMCRPEEVDMNARAIETPIDAELLREIERVVEPTLGLIWATGRAENQDADSLTTGAV